MAKVACMNRGCMRKELRAGAFILSIAVGACTVTAGEENIGVTSLAYEAASVVVPEGSSLPSLDLPRPTERGAPVPLPLPGSGLEPIEAIPDHCHAPAEHAFVGDALADGEVHLPFIDEAANAHIFTVLYDVGDDDCFLANDWSSFLDEWVTSTCTHFVTVGGNITAPPFTSGSFHVCSDENGAPITPSLCSDSPVLEKCKGPAAPPLDPGAPTVTGPNAIAYPPGMETEPEEQLASRD
ncbi:MAG: hypothetical protein BGO98_00240 [Myxococcales bacterium 68-20]|nr:MAG: hypothetical protein BGO98_00240 [Myxococcales bacterium 68-20]